MIKFNIYALYDKKAKTLGQPFLSVNNEVALRQLKQTQENMKNNGLVGYEDMSVMYLGQYQMNVIENYENGILTSFDESITDTENQYDVLNAFDNSIAREGDTI